jgi:DNA-binding response OmpR family regulator
MDTAGQRPVVLLDVDLPGIDGFRVLHELSGSRPGDYQVILCTIHNSEATQVLGIQSGALDYLVKPLRMPIVLAKVERLIGQGSYNNVAHG